MRYWNGVPYGTLAGKKMVPVILDALSCDRVSWQKRYIFFSNIRITEIKNIPQIV
jgi:hypothetical protein